MKTAWIQFVPSLLLENTEDTSNERPHKLHVEYCADPTDLEKARPHFPLT